MDKHNKNKAQDQMTAVCCNQCFTRIAKKDTKAARLWSDICAFFVKLDGNFILRESKVPWVIPQFKLLEKLGYILTADSEDGVKVRVNGYDVLEMEDHPDYKDTFCLDREAHFESWQ